MLARFTFLLITLLAFACGSEPKIEEGRHYATDNSFSFVPPENWEQGEMPGFKYKVFSFTPHGEFSPNINVVNEKFAGSLEEYTSANLASLDAMIPSWKLEREFKVQLDSGAEAHAYSSTAEMWEMNLKQTGFLFDGGDTKFIMTFTQEQSDPRDLSDVVENCVRTFRVE